MGDWEFVKRRTAADGAVWRSPDGLLYKRTGGEALREEADFQRLVGGLGYPVPEVVASGVENGYCFFTERSLGDASLHDEALSDALPDGRVSDRVLSAAADVSIRLLQAQSHSPLPTSREAVRAWFEQAAVTDNVFAENPDLDTPRVHTIVGHALDRLGDVPMCRSHLDYGLPSAFRGGVIDWQHHGPAPLGYDVYPMLDIVAFKGGGKGYTVTPEQRARYLTGLDEVSTRLGGRRLSEYLGEFLLVKCFFFLALMRPTDPTRHDKHANGATAARSSPWGLTSMSRRTRSTPQPSPPWQSSPKEPGNTAQVIRDRDHLLDRDGVIFKVIGDVHPDSHYLGYVKYHPDDKGDRRLFDRTYRQNSVVSKSFGILADRPECYVYSDVLGCVITGLPREDVVAHYSCRQALKAIHDNPSLVEGACAGKDLAAIIERVMARGAADLLGVTGSFLVGCFNEGSDIDLVCYGQAGYQAARELFRDTELIRPYEGCDLTRLYVRRAKYMAGCDFDALIKQEQRKLQGLTAHADAHINCEPLRSDGDRTFSRVSAKEIGQMALLAEITDHVEGLATPALYGITVKAILSSTVDEPNSFARRITHMRSYLGAYTGAFRSGDTVHLGGKLVHTQDGEHSGFGIELTPWSVTESYLANLTE